MNNKKHDLTLFRHSMMWLEKYIEVKELLPNWSNRKQTDFSHFIRRNWDKNTPESDILKTLGTSLLLGFGCKERKRDKMGGRRDEYKSEFYKWINAIGINNDNCPQKLKIVLFSFHEIIKDRQGGQRILSEAENAKRELEPDSPEYQKQLEQTFSLMSENFANGKAFEVDGSRFDGNAETGKATFEAIANSLSASDQENFHFFPQMSNEENIEEERKNKERQSHTHPILQAWRTNSIAKITAALNQEPKLTNNDLKPENQNWEVEINLTEDIVKIQNIQNWVLSDIEEKRQKKLTLLQQQKKWKTTKMILAGGAILASLSLIIILIFYYRKKNAKRK